MTFTNALIGVLVIAIVLVAVDALRRMWTDRNGIRMKIDPRFHDLPVSTNSELPGGGVARVVRKPKDEQAVQNAPLMMEAEDDTSLIDRQPFVVEDAEEDRAPVMMQPKPVATPTPRVTPQPMPQPVPPPIAKAPTQPTPQPKSDKPAASPIIDVIVVHLVFPQGLSGERLLQSLLQQGLRYGEMKIFHLHQQSDLLFSLANAHEPGYFNIDAMEQERFRAVTFFVKLPGPAEPLLALNRMLNTAQWLARELEGELRDENRIVLTQQMMEHLRERVQEFERRQRVPDAF